MIRRSILTIMDHKQVATDTFFIRLHSKEPLSDIDPGQFIHIKIGSGHLNVLRRPISITDIDPVDQELTIIFKTVGVGTDYLSSLTLGDQLDCLLPCGTAYPIDSLTVKKALLIGGGIGVPPLYYLAKRLNQEGIAVTVILGFQSADHIFLEKEFRSLGSVYIATNDGSYGYKGLVTDVYKHEQPSFDKYFACGPSPMLKNVKVTLAPKQGYLSLEERMGCGIGACFACVIPTPEGAYKKICQDGPVFKAEEVVIE